MKVKKRVVTLRVNGETYEIAVEPRRRLLDAIRYDCGLTGTKEGCATGDCGACTVLIDGKPVTSCLVLAVSAEGKEITTIEGLAQNGNLHPLQIAFMQCGGLQCGFCTPGLILSAKALLDENPSPTDEEVQFALAGNLCRCTGYTKIIDSVKKAAEMLREQASAKH